MSKNTALILGVLLWLALFVALAFTAVGIYRLAYPQAQVLVALSISFSESGLMRISGQTAVDGVRPSIGLARLSVRRLAPPLRRTVLVDVKDGLFEATGIPELTGLRRSDRILVHAEVFTHEPASAEGPSPAPGSGPRQEAPAEAEGTAEAVVQASHVGPVLSGEQSATWNMSPWMTRLPAIAVGVVAGMGLFMFLVFTGPYTTGKNRVAVGAAYLMAAFALTLPFLGPFTMHAYPSLKAAMVESPVGLVPVRTAGGETEAILLNQWSLNLGGIPRRVLEPPPALPLPQVSESATGEKGGGSGTGGAVREESAAGLFEVTATEAMFDVQGGLVIPLYALVLGLLGGAVNMVRRVPALQRDAGGVALGEDVRRAGRRVLDVALFRDVRVSEPETAGDGGEVARSNSRLRELTPGAVVDGVLDAAQEGRWQREMNALRGGLVNQYVYLLGAPVLAILGFYLLFLIEATLAESVPLVAALSFAAGLSSESVIGRVGGLGRRLRRDMPGDRDKPVEGASEQPRRADRTRSTRSPVADAKQD